MRRPRKQQAGAEVREDIAAALPAYPNARRSGFVLSSALPAGEVPESIAVEAIDISGSVNRVVVGIERLAAAPKAAEPAPMEPEPAQEAPAARQVTNAPDPRQAIFVHCDTATVSVNGELTISGWAVCATGIAVVVVNLDGEAIGEAELGLPRPDVAEVYPGIPQAHYSGFRLRQRLASPFEGEHELHVLARNGLDDIRDLSVPLKLGEPEPAATTPAAPATETDEFRFQLDNPAVINSLVPVIRRLVMEGWELGHSGVQEAPAARQVTNEPDPRRAIFVYCDMATVSADGELDRVGLGGLRHRDCRGRGQSRWRGDRRGRTGSAAVGTSPRNTPGIPQAHYSGFRLRRCLASPFEGEHELHVLARNGLDDTRDLPVPLKLAEPEPAATGPAAPATGADEFRFQLDNPIVINGVVPDPVIGRLVIEGWAGPRRMRVLFVEDLVPLRRIGSGFVRSNDILQVMASLGYQVTVFPIYPGDADPATIFGDMPDTVRGGI